MPNDLICEECHATIPPGENNWSDDDEHPLCMTCFYADYALPVKRQDLELEVERRR